MNNNNYFREHKIPKKKGGTRTIYIYKDDEMKKRHKTFLKNIKTIEKQYNIKISYTAVGFTKYSLHESVKRHRTNTCFLQMDLKDFFPSITEDLMYTHIPLLMRFQEVRECFQDGKLCQGSVLAPWISNVFMYKFDKELSKISFYANMKYTRYADDIVISFTSFNEGQTKEILSHCLNKVKENIVEIGLEINDSKTQFRYKGKHNHVKVLGFNIAFTKGGNKITIGRKTYKDSKKVYPFHFHAKKDIRSLKVLGYGKCSWEAKYNEKKGR